MHTWEHKHTLKNTLPPSPKPLTFLELPQRNVCSEGCAFLLNYYVSPDGSRTQHVTSDTLLAESLSKLPGWERFSVSVKWRRAWVWEGVSKVALGHHNLMLDVLWSRFKETSGNVYMYCRSSLVTLSFFVWHLSYTLSTWSCSYNQNHLLLECLRTEKQVFSVWTQVSEIAPEKDKNATEN